MLSWEWFLQTVQPESAIAPWSCPSFSNENMAGIWLTSSVSHIINMLCQGPSCFLGKHEHPEGLSGGTKAESDSLSEHPVWSSGCSLYHVGNSGHFLIYCWTKFVNIISVLFYLIREQLNFVEQHCLQLQTLKNIFIHYFILMFPDLCRVWSHFATVMKTGHRWAE